MVFRGRGVPGGTNYRQKIDQEGPQETIGWQHSTKDGLKSGGGGYQEGIRRVPGGYQEGIRRVPGGSNVGAPKPRKGYKILGEAAMLAAKPQRLEGLNA